MNSAAPVSPMASCVMATTPWRRGFLEQALKYYARQSWAPRELIIVDDPGTSAAELVSRYPTASYLQTDRRLSLGAKLNLAIAQARGTLIQKLDDDDYYHPEFLATTAATLLSAPDPRAVVACGSCLVLIAATGEVKLWSGLFAGGTLCFRRYLWVERPFRDVELGEDRHFLQDHAATQVSLDRPELYVYLRHTGGHAWSRIRESVHRDGVDVRAGDDVTQTLRRLPDFAGRIEDCIPAADLAFYRAQRLSDRGAAPAR